MFEVDELKGTTALRIFADQVELELAASQLLKTAREREAVPGCMEFGQMPDYEETGQYQVVLWCT